MSVTRSKVAELLLRGERQLAENRGVMKKKNVFVENEKGGFSTFRLFCGNENEDDALETPE